MTKLLLIGCGKMGGALLSRIAGGIEAVVVDPAPAPEKFKPAVTWLAAPEQIEPAFIPNIAVLAVKPQYMAAALPSYRRFTNTVFLSIAAGTTLARLTELLGSGNFALVRSMPNLPASIGQGISVAKANKNVSAAQHALCDKILRAFGEVLWTEDEAQLDAVTALSGSGPAYVFALAESMAKAGVAAGLPAAMAEKLARQTVIGSGALLAQSPESAEALRVAVTSPGGTTEAALKCLLAAGGLPELIEKAVKAGTERSKELAK